MKIIWKVKSLEHVVQGQDAGIENGDGKNPNEECVLSQFTAVALIIFKLTAGNAGMLGTRASRLESWRCSRNKKYL